MRYVYTAVVLIGCLFAQFAGADTTVRTAEQFELTEDEVVTGNFFGSGHPVILSGQVSEDALLFGNRVTINGLVEGDVLASGVFVTHAGVVQSDIKAAGGSVIISGIVEGDLFVTAGTVEITSEAKIGGDVLVYAGEVSIAGQVGGDVLGSASEMLINGPIAGGVSVAVNQLDLGQNASVTAAVQYESSNLVTQNLNATIAGEILRTDPATFTSERLLPVWLMVSIMVVFATFAWVLVARNILAKIVKTAGSHVMRSAAIGVGILVTVPIVLAVLFSSVLGAFVGLLAALGYLLALVLAVVCVPALVGRTLVQLAALRSVSVVSLSSVTIGSITCLAILLVPLVGVLVLCAVCIVVLGALVEELVRAIR